MSAIFSRRTRFGSSGEVGGEEKGLGSDGSTYGTMLMQDLHLRMIS